MGEVMMHGGVDDLQELISAATPGQVVIMAGEVYSISAPVVIPAGVSVYGYGASIKLMGKGSLVFAGAGSSVRGVSFLFDNFVSLTGGEYAVRISAENITVEDCRFLGNGYRYGIYINHPANGSCDDATIRGNRFDKTGFAVFKQGSKGTTANHLKISNNVFRGIARGDAIELNIGADVGYAIHHNDIDGVDARGVVNAGFGIGVAGNYTSDLSTQPREFYISDNLIRNCSAAGIHVEGSNSYSITNNRLHQDGLLTGAGKGIECFGGVAGTISGNEIGGWAKGIGDDLGVTAGKYVVGTDETIIKNNRVTDCSTGIYSGIAGDLKRSYVDTNTIIRCNIGVHQLGSAIVRVDGNTLVDCVEPFRDDSDHPTKVGLTKNKRPVELTGNHASTNGDPQPMVL